MLHLKTLVAPLVGMLCLVVLCSEAAGQSEGILVPRSLDGQLAPAAQLVAGTGTPTEPSDPWVAIQALPVGTAVRLTSANGLEATGRLIEVGAETLVLEDSAAAMATAGAGSPRLTIRRANVRSVDVLAPPPIVETQELANSFNQLRVLVRPGDAVSVTDRAGRVMKGTIAELSSTSLGLVVAAHRYRFLESDISTIRQRRSDSLRNGALLGFGIGAGFGLLGFRANSGYDGTLVLIGVGLYGGLGAAMGAGVDAMVSGNQVIYSRAAGSARVTLRPALTRGRVGVLASLAF